MTTRDEALRQIEQEAGVLFRRGRRVIRERARLIHPDLQPGAYLVLGHLQKHGPLRATTMCAVLDLDKAAVSRQVQHLLELGLVDRTPDPEDGRATLVQLSSTGAERMADVVAQRREGLSKRLGDWSVADLTAFAADMRRYNAALGD